MLESGNKNSAFNVSFENERKSPEPVPQLRLDATFTKPSSQYQWQGIHVRKYQEILRQQGEKGNLRNLLKYCIKQELSVNHRMDHTVEIYTLHYLVDYLIKSTPSNIKDLLKKWDPFYHNFQILSKDFCVEFTIREKSRATKDNTETIQRLQKKSQTLKRSENF